MVKINANYEAVVEHADDFQHQHNYQDRDSWVNRLKYDYGQYASQLSPDNPYLRQMIVSSKKSELAAVWAEAIKWEADQHNYKQQMADAAELREDEREYNSPQAIAARQRAAGLNPDLIASAGGSTGGSAPSVPNPALPSTNSPDLAGMENAEASRLNAVTGLVSTIGSLALGTLNGIGNIATLGSQISSARSIADMQKLQLAQQVIPMLPYSVSQDEETGEWNSSVSDTVVRDTMKALGLNYKDDELVFSITSTANNPQYRAFRFNGAYEAWKAENDYSVGLTMYRKTAQAEAGLKFYEACAGMNMAYFNDAVSSMFSSDSGTLDDGTSWDTIADNPYVLQAQEAAALRSGNSVTEAKVNKQALERAVQAFEYNVNMSNQFQSQIDNWITDLEKQDNTVENQASIRSLRALKAEIGSYSASQFSQMYATFFKAAYNYSFRNAVGPKMTQGETAIWGEQFDFIGTLYQHDRADHGNPVDMFVDFIKQFIPGFNFSKSTTTVVNP